MILANITEKCLPPCKNRSHSHSTFEYRFDTGAYMCQNRTNYNLTSHVLVICVPVIQIYLLRCIYISYIPFLTGLYGEYMSICVMYEVTGMNHVTRNIVHTLQTTCHIITTQYQQVRLSPHKYRPCCLHSTFAYTYNTDYICKSTTNCNIEFTCHCHICVTNKYAHQSAHTFGVHI